MRKLSIATLPTRALASALVLTLAASAHATDPDGSLWVPQLRASATDATWLTLTLATQEAPDGQLGQPILVSAGTDAERRPIPLHFDLALDASVTGAAALAVLFLGIFEGKLTPTCRWCVPGPIDTSIRNAVVWGNPNTADVASSIIATAVPVALAAYLYFSASGEGDKTAGLEDLLIATETVSLNQVLTETVKLAAARQRPWAYFGNNGGTGTTPTSLSSQANLSFYGGHNSFAFASVSAGLTIAVMRGYPGAWIVAAAGYPTAAFIAYLRMAADQHYFTDVLTGALIGGFVGFAIPYFFHNRNLSGPGAMRPAPGGVAILF
jgi:membrane-associated phospholipid phosphatase